RLACVRPAASVHSEPGSNPSLKVFGPKPKDLSAVLVQAKLLAAFACFESTWFCSNACKMDNHPPARRPHKSPAHTVKDLGNRPQRLASVPVGVSPQGAAHDSAVLAFVNTPRESPDASLQLAGREAVSSKGAAHSSPFFLSVNTP